MIEGDELAQYREAFALFDKDGNGTISARDIGIVLRSLGATPTEADVSDIVRTSGGADGTILFDDFLSHVQRLMPLKYSAQDVIEAFRIFDKDGNGLVSVAEVRHVVTTLGEKLSDDEVDEMLREARVTSQGMLNYADFVETMMSSAK